MLKTLVVGAAAALLMTSNAVADGMPRRAAKAAPVCCEPNWTGFYIGVGVGGAFTVHDHSAKHIVEEKNYLGETTYLDVRRLWDLDGGRAHAFGTVTVGYDHQFSGHWVVGLFADYDFGNGDNNHRIHSIEGTGLSDIHHSNENKHAWSIGGRLGFLSSPSTLLFLSTGWTQVSFDRDLHFTWDGTVHRRSFDSERDGWFIGAGMETQLGWLHPGLSLRGEYRYTRLDDDHRKFTYAEGGCGECGSWSRRLEFDHDVDVHSVRVVLAYKFGRRETVAAPLK
jgi:outer membrane immunogenic protein